jgi:hypothetical protein
VIIYKVVNGRYLEKRVNIRVEHIRHSKCRQEFLDRVKSNAALKREAKEKGEFVQLKRLPAQPRLAHKISIHNNVPETLTAKPCESESGCILVRCVTCANAVSRRDHHLRRRIDLGLWGEEGLVRWQMDCIPLARKTRIGKQALAPALALALAHWAHCFCLCFCFVSISVSVSGIAHCLPAEIDHFLVAFQHPSVLSPPQMFREQVHNLLEA